MQQVICACDININKQHVICMESRYVKPQRRLQQQYKTGEEISKIDRGINFVIESKKPLDQGDRKRNII